MTFGRVSQGHNLKKAAPSEELPLVTLKVGFAENSSRGNAAQGTTGGLSGMRLQVGDSKHHFWSIYGHR